MEPIVPRSVLPGVLRHHLAQSHGLFLRLFNLTPLRLMGLWSYSIYLWQQPFYEFKASMPYGTALIAAMVISLASQPAI